MARRIRIIDATLREGMQAPGKKFSKTDTVEIAEALGRAGVDMIECGHPGISDNEATRVQSIISKGHLPPVLAHARCCEADIDAVSAAGVPWIGIFLGLNAISQRTRVRKPVKQLIDLVQSGVSHARSRGLRVRYSLEDASRTDWNTASRAYSAALDAGADRLCFTDSVGVLEPAETSKWISRITKEFPGTPLEVHFHDDRGLALANALAAIDSGCDWISCSVNGVGERCGITDLVALSANLLYRGQRTIERPEQLQKLSDLVGRMSRSPVDHRRPVTGRHAFSHSAKLHRTAVRRDPESYSWIEPARVGRVQEINAPAPQANPAKITSLRSR